VKGPKLIIQLVCSELSGLLAVSVVRVVVVCISRKEDGPLPRNHVDVSIRA